MSKPQNIALDQMLHKDDEIEEHKYLVFKLGDELYASSLIKIREIIKIQSVKPVPFMAPYFRGILNLRGKIISVVDLRLKLEIPCKNDDSGLLVVTDTTGGPIGAVVDDVVVVQEFLPSAISRDLAIKTKIPVEFFHGVAQHSGRLVNIIDIAATLTDGDFAVVRRLREQELKKSA